MIEDVTPEILENNYKENHLGNLFIKIPKYKKISVYMDKLYPTLEQFEKIDSIVVIGSALYKNFPLKKEHIRIGKKYIFFGEDKIKEVFAPRNVKDFDLLVIGKNNLEHSEVIISYKRDYYGPVVSRIPTVVETCENFIDESYGWLPSKNVSAIDLHLIYRNKDSFVKGIGKGDTVSENALDYGVVIIGKHNFEKIVKENNFERKNVLHKVKWTRDLEGKIQGEII